MYLFANFLTYLQQFLLQDQKEAINNYIKILTDFLAGVGFISSSFIHV